MIISSLGSNTGDVAIAQSVNGYGFAKLKFFFLFHIKRAGAASHSTRKLGLGIEL